MNIRLLLNENVPAPSVTRLREFGFDILSVSESFDIQLGAQAMCLEEMLNVTIQHAAIFHAGSKRRREVEIAAQLRTEVQRTVSAIRVMLADSRLPAPTTEVRRCRECSLKDICQPEALAAMTRETHGRTALFDPDR